MPDYSILAIKAKWVDSVEEKGPLNLVLAGMG